MDHDNVGYDRMATSCDWTTPIAALRGLQADGRIQQAGASPSAAVWRLGLLRPRPAPARKRLPQPLRRLWIRRRSGPGAADLRWRCARRTTRKPSRPSHVRGAARARRPGVPIVAGGFDLLLTAPSATSPNTASSWRGAGCNSPGVRETRTYAVLEEVKVHGRVPVSSPPPREVASTARRVGGSRSDSHSGAPARTSPPPAALRPVASPVLEGSKRRAPAFSAVLR